jgi:hypothetical protein
VIDLAKAGRPGTYAVVLASSGSSYGFHILLDLLGVAEIFLDYL